MSVFEEIKKQMKGKEGLPEWNIGKQLTDICREEGCAAIVEKDLKAITLKKAAEKLQEYADEQHKKRGRRCVAIDGATAERIIRECYGLPDAAAPVEKKEEKEEVQHTVTEASGGDFLNLDDFL